MPGSTPSAPETVTAISVVARDAAEEHARGLGREVDARHASRRAPCGRTEAAAKRSSWASLDDEDELGVVRRGCRAHDRVAGLEPDDLELGRAGSAEGTMRFTTP